MLYTALQYKDKTVNKYFMPQNFYICNNYKTDLTKPYHSFWSLTV